MPNKKTFSCYLIGDDHLLVECADIILNNGHQILGIISPLAAVKHLAITHHIHYYCSLDDAIDSLSTTPFDYFFSIINSTIIPVFLLEKARYLSINFHNAPLPRYAGVHALSWAIINNEQSFGVTWHVMTDVIDGGDILKQAHFPIDLHETALSLSLKCYVHALALFHELVDELSQSSLTRIPQNKKQRSYYNFKQKPPGNGWISWENTAESIERLVRACELGHYHHNRLATAKMQLGTELFIIKKLHILNKTSIASPGTLVTIHPNAWHVSTKTNLVSIEQLVSLDGELYSLDSLVNRYQLHTEQRLYSPNTQELFNYHTVSEQSAAWELYWVQRLIHFKPAVLPFQSQHHNDYFGEPLVSLAQSILPESKSYLLPNYHSTDILLTALFIYLYRLGYKEQTGIWMDSSSETKSHPLLSSIVPLSLSLSNKSNFCTTINDIQTMRCTIKNKGLFQHDILYRYPELAQIEHHHYPLVLFIGTHEQCLNKHRHLKAAILITISSDTNTMTWWAKKSLSLQESSLANMIKKSVEYLGCLLNSLPETLQQPISQLPIMSKHEHQVIMMQWGNLVTHYPKQKTIHALFEEQALLTPNLIAITYGTKSLTYDELNKKANQLAYFLQKQGLLPNSFAAICTAQDLHLIIGMIAILKTGAAYIPIDTNYPKQHIQYVFEDSKPSLLLASHDSNDALQQNGLQLTIPIIFFDDIATITQQESINNPNYAYITSNSLAYIIYTSGTTGKPKGVMVPHQGVTRLVNNTNYITIKQHDKIAQAASISFDAATFEIWGALLNGATLIAVSHATLLDSTKFAAFLEKKMISILWVTAALFNQYATQNPSMFRHLTYLLVGGDVLNKERIMSVLNNKQGAPKNLLNGYGPTENTTFTTTYSITKKDEQYETIPIGKPIASTSVYILDEQLQPCLIGAIGELYIGGDGLAFGYLNQPELTQEKFIRNPFSTKDSRIYKTGDRVRWMPDGNIEYLGRQDNQVKIRGFRVELEAIQAYLLQHPAISQCSIRAEESNKHDKVLVAYIVCNHHVSDKELQVFISDQLPKYMIPSFFMRLDKMPLTTNGKVNYKKLPKPDFNKPSLEIEQVEPSTPQQKALANIWCALLGCDTVGIEDNFFDLGGHSLLITQLILQIKNTYHTDLPLHEFLENPTISHLDKLIKGNQDATIKVHTNHSMMLTDRYLSPELQPTEDIINKHSSQYILLTGASGFLGANLLYDLYHMTTATIYCLVRAKNKNDAIERINKALTKYQFNLRCNKRIIALQGDLTQPNLGLSNTKFNRLSQKIDVIFHNGAAVNHLYNYTLLRSANVVSTIDIIRFAMQYKIKPIHYISTLSAATHFIDESNHIIEGFMNANNTVTPPSDGYSQTKWVAEQLLAEASQRGLLVNIYRPGWIVGHTQTGVINAESNHLLMLIKGCIQLKAAPNWNMMLDMIPVDSISSMIIHLSTTVKNNNSVFNLINPSKITWVNLIQYLNTRGYSISLVEPLLWKEEHLKSIDKNNALYSLYPLYINAQQDDWMKGLASISHANNDNTINAFNRLSKTIPPINQSLLNIYFDYLEKNEFINRSFSD